MTLRLKNLTLVGSGYSWGLYLWRTQRSGDISRTTLEELDLKGDSKVISTKIHREKQFWASENRLERGSEGMQKVDKTLD